MYFYFTADTYTRNIGLDNYSVLEDITIDQPDPFSTFKPLLIFDLKTSGFGKYVIWLDYCIWERYIYTKILINVH